MNSEKQNISAITLYRIFSRMYFYLPILFPLFFHSGLSVFKIEILLAVYGITIVFLLHFAKRLTDRIGHKYALMLGECFKILGLIILMLYANNFTVSIILQIIMGFGYAMIVGNDTVILQRAFSPNVSNEYQNVQAKTNSYMFLSLLFSGLLGALFFKYSSTIVLLLSIIAAIFSIISIIFIKYEYQPHTSHSIKKQLTIDHFAKTYYFVIRGIVLAVFVGVLPYFLYVVMKTSMIYFAIVLSSFTLSGFISSKYLTKYVKKYNFNVLFSISLILILSSLALLLLHSVYLSFITALILGLVSGCIRPVTISKIKASCSVEQTLNKAEFNYGIFNAILLISAGLFLQYLDFSDYIISLIIFAFVYTIFCILINNLREVKIYENSLK